MQRLAEQNYSFSLRISASLRLRVELFPYASVTQPSEADETDL